MKKSSLSVTILAMSVGPLAIVQANAQTQGPIVAVVDTGVDLTHSEFTGRMLRGACFSWTTCPASVQTGDDDHNHGSHVAGIIAAANNGVGNTGVAPFARILPVKVLDAGGSGDLTSIARGIDFARTNGARVINMSLGGSGGSAALLTSLRAAKSTSVLVAAAGNQGNSYRPLWPAAYTTDAQVLGSMLIVGSVGPTNVISRFSNTPGTGGCVSTSAGQRCWRDFFVVAPGENILSAGKDGNYIRMSGTSMATPFVAGAAALVVQQSPFLTPAQVVDILKKSATDLGARGVDPVYGWGLVNPARAVSPLGTTRIATSGSMTVSFSGASGAGVSSLSAPWSGAVLNSNTISNAIMFDSYGRDFDAGLSVRAVNRSFDAFAATSFAPASWDMQTHSSDGVYMQAAKADVARNAVAALSSHGGAEVGYDHFLTVTRVSGDADLTFGHRAPVAGVFNSLDLAAGPAQDQIFLGVSALNSPYADLADGGSFGGMTWRSGDTWTFSAAYTSASEAEERVQDSLAPRDALLAQRNHIRSADAVTTHAAYRFDDTLTVGASLAMTGERNGLLGSEEQGALALTAEAQTVSTGVQARLSLENGWAATASWAAGISDVTPVEHGLAKDFSAVTSQSYGFALTKQGVFGRGDVFGFAISRPLHVTDGEATIIASTGVTEAREIVYTRERISLAAEAPETQIEVGYAAFLGDAMRIGVSAIYQDNAYGIEGQSSVGAVARLRAEF